MLSMRPLRQLATVNHKHATKAGRAETLAEGMETSSIHLHWLQLQSSISLLYIPTSSQCFRWACCSIWVLLFRTWPVPGQSVYCHPWKQDRTTRQCAAINLLNLASNNKLIYMYTRGKWDDVSIDAPESPPWNPEHHKHLDSPLQSMSPSSDGFPVVVTIIKYQIPSGY